MTHPEMFVITEFHCKIIFCTCCFEIKNFMKRIAFVNLCVTMPAQISLKKTFLSRVNFIDSLAKGENLLAHRVGWKERCFISLTEFHLTLPVQRAWILAVWSMLVILNWGATAHMDAAKKCQGCRKICSLVPFLFYYIGCCRKSLKAR